MFGSPGAKRELDWGVVGHRLSTHQFSFDAHPIVRDKRIVNLIPPMAQGPPHRKVWTTLEEPEQEQLSRSAAAGENRIPMQRCMARWMRHIRCVPHRERLDHL
jgi:hypothetical protein